MAEMNTYLSFVSVLLDAGAKDENKLKAAQELSENLEVIVSSPQYPAFLDHAMKNFLKILTLGFAFSSAFVFPVALLHKDFITI